VISTVTEAEPAPTNAELRAAFDDRVADGMPADDAFRAVVVAHLARGGQRSGGFGRWEAWAMLFGAAGLKVGPRLLLISIGLAYDLDGNLPTVASLAVASSQKPEAVGRQLSDLAEQGLVEWIGGRLAIVVPEGLTPGLVEWSA
jgi:hypothetical protein